MNSNAPLISLDRIAVRQRDRWLLNGLSWRIHAGEQWVVTGPNGAGKTTLAKAIAGLLPVVRGRITYHTFAHRPPTDAIAYVASDARRDLWRQERARALSRDFAGRFSETTSTREFLQWSPIGGTPMPEPSIALRAVAASCRLDGLLDRPLMSLSTGEMSRVLIARQLMRRPQMLILDEPFEGLDAQGRQALMQMLDRLAGDNLPMVLITHRAEERLAVTTHLLALVDGRITWSGPVDRQRPGARKGLPPDARRIAPDPVSSPSVPLPKNGNAAADALIDMRSVTVRYGDTIVLDRISWSVREGEHWAVTGPNGAGKSTLLKLITGDCLQVHANHIHLFGQHRGPRQTLAAVRQQLGVVSHELAAGYQKQMSALDVVCSGFFDSVGLYRHCDTAQVETGRRQLARMDMAALAAVPFNHLSQGQRQMVLIARAMVKHPRLLLLDEPLSGLDQDNRNRVMALVMAIGQAGRTGLIVISHHPREIPTLTTHQLVLDRGRVCYCGPIGNG